MGLTFRAAILQCGTYGGKTTICRTKEGKLHNREGVGVGAASWSKGQWNVTGKTRSTDTFHCEPGEGNYLH